MTFYSFRWLADRISDYGWTLAHMAGRKWCYLGKGLPYIVIEVEERRVRGRPMTVVEKRWVDVFDECIQDLFGETIYDGSEEEIPDDQGR